MHQPSTGLRIALAALTLGAALLLVVISPALFVITLVADLVRAPRRWRLTRLVAMVLNYLLLECLGIVLAGLLWIATGFGAAMSVEWSQTLHYRVQRWWGRSMLRAARRWLGLRVEFEGLDAIGDAPLILAAHHASFFDALLPTVAIAERTDRAARHVLKRELAWDPCLGIFGHRQPNQFVTRGGAERHATISEIERLAATAGDDALVIFPEGTFYSPERSARINAHLAQADPVRHSRLQLSHLLPPRPGGIGALLRGRPESDLVFLGHVGFEAFGSLRSIIANAPFTDPVRARLWHVPASQIPEDPARRLDLIDAAWQQLDDWVSTQRGPAGSPESPLRRAPAPHP